MFKLIAQKYEGESISTAESTWATVSAQLPLVKTVSMKDLATIRANEDAFDIWRTALRDTVRGWENELERKGRITPEGALEIFNESTLAIRMTLESKVKTKSLKSNIESGGVSFCTGAIAAASLSFDPLSAIAAGAVSSSLKVVYDVLKARNAVTDRTLLRVFSQFGGVD